MSSVEIETKYCPGCEVDKPTERFGKNAARKDGLQVYCKTCSSLKVQMSKRNSKKADATASKLKRLTFYGLTPEEYDLMLFEQNGKCPICRKEMEQPQIDYDPITGVLMALLCNDCRSAKTLLKNNLELTYRLSAYMESYILSDSPE